MPNLTSKFLTGGIEGLEGNGEFISLLSQIEINTRKRPQQTFEIKMTTNNETFTIDPPIVLHEGDTVNPQSGYSLGLISLSVYNTIYNVTEKNNNFRYFNGEHWFDINLPPGTYELTQINEEIQKFTGELITIEPNVSTQKSEMILAKGYMVDFTPVNSIAKLLGFKPSQYNNIEDERERLPVLDMLNGDSRTIIPIRSYGESRTDYGSQDHMFPPLQDPNLSEDLEVFEPHKRITSQKVVEITTIDKIHLNCDKVDGSILNGSPSSILYSFNVDVSPGYRIIEQPKTILYKNIQATKLESLNFYILDDDGNEVDFNGETISLTLQLIKN